MKYKAKLPRSTFSHLWQLGRLMRSRIGERIALSMPQMETLHFIAEEGSPTMRQLAHYLKVKAPSATAVVVELVRIGLVRRSIGSDRRSVAVALTAKGRRRFDETLATRKRVVSEVLSGLSARQRAEFDGLLEIILTTNQAKF